MWRTAFLRAVSEEFQHCDGFLDSRTPVPEWGGREPPELFKGRLAGRMARPQGQDVPRAVL